MAGDWRAVLSDDPTNARPIVSSLLLKGRVTYTPLEPKQWEMSGDGTLEGLFKRLV